MSGISLSKMVIVEAAQNEKKESSVESIRTEVPKVEIVDPNL